MNDGSDGESSGLISTSDRVGWNVVTPFCLEGGSRDGETILINRGWISKNKLDPSKRKDSQIDGTVELEGVVRKTESRPQFATKNKTEGCKWPYR